MFEEKLPVVVGEAKNHEYHENKEIIEISDILY